MDFLERVINNVSELQAVIDKEIGRTDIEVKDFKLFTEHHEHPETKEQFDRFGATAVIVVGGKEYNIDKNSVKFFTAPQACNAIIAYVKYVCCNLTN